MSLVDGEPTERRVVKSFCRICTAVCGILVEVEGDHVVKVRGDADHPLSHGYTCAKGRALPQVHHHPDRIERPLLRRDGALEPSAGATLWTTSVRGCEPSSTSTGRRRSACTSAAGWAWTPPATR